MCKQWRTEKLGELLRRSEETVDPVPDAEYREITVRLWGNGVIERGRATGASLSGRRFVARAGQFIVSRIDARNGAMGIVPASLEGALVTNDFPLFKINSARLESAFLGWLCRTPAFVELCRRASEGTTNRVRLKEERFSGLEIHLPQIEEQRRIVARIDELAAKIQEARQIRNEASVIFEQFCRASAAKRIKAIASKYSERPISELVAIRGGGTPSKSDPSFWNGSIPWITPKDMKKRELSDAIDHITEAATRNTAAKLIEPGAVLVVVRGMILAHTFPSAILKARAAINQDMKALIPNEGLLPEFLCATLWARNSEFLALVEKSTHDTRKLETEKLMNMRIAVPPIAEQMRFLANLNELEDELGSLRRLQSETAVELDALLPSILSKAFSGEL